PAPTWRPGWRKPRREGRAGQPPPRPAPTRHRSPTDQPTLPRDGRSRGVGRDAVHPPARCDAVLSAVRVVQAPAGVWWPRPAPRLLPPASVHAEHLVRLHAHAPAGVREGEVHGEARRLG